MTLEPAVSTNPFIEFQSVVPETDSFSFTRYDDDEFYTEIKDITVD